MEPQIIKRLNLNEKDKEILKRMLSEREIEIYQTIAKFSRTNGPDLLHEVHQDDLDELKRLIVMKKRLSGIRVRSCQKRPPDKETLFRERVKEYIDNQPTR